MLESFSPEKRNRTFLLLTAFAVFAIAAGVIGISDNAVGISLVVLSAASLVLAIVHSWSTSVLYRRLAVASALGFIVLLALGIALSASLDLTYRFCQVEFTEIMIHLPLDRLLMCLTCN